MALRGVGGGVRWLAWVGGRSQRGWWPNSQSAVLDGHGRLWVADTKTGDLSSVGPGRTLTRRGLKSPGPARLVLAGVLPVLIDPAGRRALVLDPDTGEVTSPCRCDCATPHTPPSAAHPAAPASTVLGGPQGRGLVL